MNSVITSEDISNIMNTFFSGTTQSTYREGTDSIPIVVRAGESFRDSIEDLANLSVAAGGQLISLDQVATFEPKLEFSQLRRVNQVREIEDIRKEQLSSRQRSGGADGSRIGRAGLETRV